MKAQEIIKELQVIADYHSMAAERATRLAGIIAKGEVSTSPKASPDTKAIADVLRKRRQFRKK